MPFDKISPRQLFLMRVFTGIMFMVMGAGLAFLAARCALDPAQHSTRLAAPAEWMFYFAALNFGVFLTNAGMMLLELVTKPPFKMAINVPFVAANFQTAIVAGLIALGFSLQHLSLAGTASSDVVAIQWLCIAGFGMNLSFVIMTKMHWNFTENTGKPLPKE